MSSRSIADIFEAWKTTHDQLVHATQSFFDACVTLLQAIDESPAGFARDRSAELAAMGVYNRTQTISTVKQQVEESQSNMRRITNTSTTRMPINVLPLEVMSRIFELVVSSSACTDDKLYLISPSPFGRSYRLHPLVSIPSVCTRWRQLAVGTPSLWSHVDIRYYLRAKIDKNVLPRTRFWLKRAHGAPLSLHIGTIYQESGNGQELLSLLKPHIGNISSLKFSGDSGAYFWSILQLYAKVCPLGSLARLSLCGVRGDDFTAGPFAWPINALHGLTSLHIGDVSPTHCPSMDQVINMLMNSPALHTLRLRSTLFVYIDGQNHPKVDLPCLRLLQLDNLRDYVLLTLLSILVPGPLGLNVRLLLHREASGESRAAVLLFLKRTNIFCLGLKGEGSTELAEQLSCMPKLRILELVYHTGESCANLDALTVLIAKDKYGARCPSLQLLWITGGAISSEAYTQLQCIASCHSLSAIVFGDRTDIHNHIRGTVVGRLRKRVANVVYQPNRSFGSFVSQEWVPYFNAILYPSMDVVTYQ